ncbi:Transposon Ty3-G Gag-Pol polyprotein [Cucumis melo var. makuwa]|uniref:Transposon Ty3-G Gag-Pol polyprotein n=1 Tax=Cucumis melo var. makuwa TaxID=1194695 RepID=A0A5D3DJC1_CUCMM|nr:Transposon Ty3-G Gag-Pol polyprotein [Cucumis melo var. makuwa]TYK23734.1 Transposon Ty3-G Gag-Pol polyprotein [Cucumis melo var. makuwa]
MYVVKNDNEEYEIIEDTNYEEKEQNMARIAEEDQTSVILAHPSHKKTWILLLTTMDAKASFDQRLQLVEQAIVELRQDNSDSSDEDNLLNIHQEPQRGLSFLPYNQEDQEIRMKVDLPTFNGRMDVEKFLDWIKNVENFFDYANASEHKKVQLVALKLQGGASAWWDQLQNNRRLFGKQPLRSWPKMLRLMKKRFLPINYQQLLYNQYQQCHQGLRSIMDYTEEFYRLGARSNLPETEHQQISRIIHGLQEEIKDVVNLHLLTFLLDAISIASKIEDNEEIKKTKIAQRKNNWDKQRANPTNSFRNFHQGSSSSTSQPTKKDENLPKFPTTKLGEINTKKKVDNVYTRPTLGKCFKCGQQGHLSNECP